VVNAPLERLSAALADRYRIERELGAGGMANVYLAEDLKHERKVAIKVLKPELAAVLGADRFIVEIKTTAALQHPHILPLFDSGTADGFLFYVMPYIEGETIRDKLNRETQFGVDEAVRLTREVADALDYAHRHGVIHRDIKPENILLHDGRAMVMDFGIALAVSAAAGGRMTETGLSLGTPHYMSPEQATAEKEISGRSDVYSLASVLYEMLAGQPPHLGGSAQQIIMKIITEPAEPVTKLRKTVPENVAAALAKALEKLPADRFETAVAFGAALDNASFRSATSHGIYADVALSAGWRQRVAVPALIAAGLLALTTGAMMWRPAPPAAVSRYHVDLPTGKRLGNTMWSPFSVSPDGSKLVYSGESGRLLIKSRDQLEPVELAGTEGAFNPVFSPDGSQIGFMTGAPGSADIKVMPVTGGPATTVTSTGVGGPGVAFGYDGYIYFDAGGVGPLMRVRATGDAPEAVSVRDTSNGELQHNWPDPLPNGRGVLMVIDRGGPGVNVTATNDIAVLDLETHRHHAIARGVFARYVSSGHVLFVTPTGVLMAAPFDQDRLETTGPAVALLEGVSISRGGGAVDLAISRSGTLWYSAGSGLAEMDALSVTRAGAFSPIDDGWTGAFSSLAISPDGSRLAISIHEISGEQIWIKRLTPKGALSKVTFDGVNGEPRWKPDGTELLYVARFTQNHNLFSVRADGGSRKPTSVMRGNSRAYTASWSKDGQWIVFETFGALDMQNGRDISALRTDSDSAPVVLVNSTFTERNPSLSPDGRWLLYESMQSGRLEVYVRPFPNTSEAVYQVSADGGTTPKWSRDGREIFYQNASADLMRVAVTPGTTFGFTDPRMLFSLRGVADWDVMPDGQRFVVIRERATQQRSKLVVVENFADELRRKVPE